MTRTSTVETSVAVAGASTFGARKLDHDAIAPHGFAVHFCHGVFGVACISKVNECISSRFNINVFNFTIATKFIINLTFIY